MGAIFANGTHPYFIAFYRILSKRELTQYLTQNLTQFCERNSNVNLKDSAMGSVKPKIPTGKFVVLNRVNTKGETVIHLRYFW